MMDLLFIEKWYSSQCDGEWEHLNGISIETTDNPGWHVTIETSNSTTPLSDRTWILQEKSDDDWFGYKVLGGVFEGAGSRNKLMVILDIFERLIIDASL